MNSINRFFPINNRVNKKNIVSLLWVLLLYIIVGAVFGVLNMFLGGIPVLGMVLRFICWIWDAYAFVGFVLAVVQFLGK